MRRPALVLLAAPALAAQLALPTGDWEGFIRIPGGELLIEVHLAAGSPWTGRISIPVQGLREAPLAGVAVKDGDVVFALQGIPGDPTFRGRFADGQIRGRLEQGGQAFPFELKRPAARTESLPAGLTERELTVGSAPYLLPATLTQPTGQGPWPLLVLVHGSGPQDRDERIGASRPFRDLARGLAARGIAVLRYDKRTSRHGARSAPDPSRLTVREEVVDDAAAAVALARTLPGIDAARVWVLGHSLGGYLVPRILRAAPQAAGAVLLAGSARPLEDLVLEQMRRQGAPPERLREMEAVAARIKALDPASPSVEPLLFAPAPYWIDLKGYRPAEEARTLARPLLVLQGGKDCQVGAEDYRLWQEALQSRRDVRLKLYPGLNHLFMPVEGASTGLEYAHPGQHVAPEVITDIAAWIQARR